MLAGVVTAAVLLVSSVGAAIGPARDAADGFAAALVDHRWDDAQAMLCSLDRAVPAEEVAAHYGDPAPSGYAIDGVQVFTGGGRTTAQVQLVLRTADGRSTRETLPLLREAGTWRPCP